MTDNMKKGIIALGLLASLSAYSQESYVPQAGEGIVYFLPKTKVAIDIIATKVDYQPGDFSLYASRYLRLNNISSQPESHWEIKDIQVRLVGVPDSTKAYIMKLKDKSVASNVELTDKGIVKAINTTSTEKESLPDYKLEKPQPHENARKYMTEDILMAGSSAKMAELTADEIYDIRENRSLLTKGQADFMPQDGAQLKLMLAKLDEQEEALLQLFKGTESTETHVMTFSYDPQKEADGDVLFRFSPYLGPVAADDLSGSPVYISIKNLNTLPDTQPEVGNSKKKEAEDLRYVVPGQAQVRVYTPDRTLAELNVPLAQFGHVEHLGGELFNKKYTTRVTLFPETGGIQRIDAEEPR